METDIKKLIHTSKYLRGNETEPNSDYIECNEVYGMLLKAKDIGQKEMLDNAVDWLKKNYSRFHITDAGGYVIDNNTIVEVFKNAMMKLI